MNKIIARQVAASIKALDMLGPWKDRSNLSDENIERMDIARRNLINILFSTGYELQEYTMKPIKSKHPRPLLESHIH